MNRASILIVEQAVKVRPDLILLDIMLKGEIDGIEAAARIRRSSNTPIIYMTGNDHLKTEKRLLATLPIGVLSKPAMDWELFEMIEKALKKNGARTE